MNSRKQQIILICIVLLVLELFLFAAMGKASENQYSRAMFGFGQQELLIIGIIVGIIILFVSLFKRGYQQTGRGQISVPTSVSTKKCPYCAEIIQAEAIKCKHCGSDLKKCPFCAEIIQPEAIKCKHCKADLSISDSNKKTETKENSKT